ncbi:hypothetical protein Syun_017401 [Stephania yunnanensis]|uniref:Uncharacterized protein n=1 Tax=Stephania yunnanensis TaxID=152371 RepID=A0AAP0P3C1_9MAGN
MVVSGSTSEPRLHQQASGRPELRRGWLDSGAAPAVTLARSSDTAEEERQWQWRGGNDAVNGVGQRRDLQPRKGKTPTFGNLPSYTFGSTISDGGVNGDFRCSGEPARRPARKGAPERAVAAERGGVLTAPMVVIGSTGEGRRASVAPTGKRTANNCGGRRWRDRVGMVTNGGTLEVRRRAVKGIDAREIANEKRRRRRGGLNSGSDGWMAELLQLRRLRESVTWPRRSGRQWRGIGSGTAAAAAAR